MWSWPWKSFDGPLTYLVVTLTGLFHGPWSFLWSVRWYLITLIMTCVTWQIRCQCSNYTWQREGSDQVLRILPKVFWTVVYSWKHRLGGLYTCIYIAGIFSTVHLKLLSLLRNWFITFVQFGAKEFTLLQFSWNNWSSFHGLNKLLSVLIIWFVLWGKHFFLDRHWKIWGHFVPSVGEN